MFYTMIRANMFVYLRVKLAFMTSLLDSLAFSNILLANIIINMYFTLRSYIRQKTFCCK